MAMADNRRRIMPFPDDRLPGRCQTLAYPEAALLVNPKDPRLKDEVLVADIFYSTAFVFLKLLIVCFLSSLSFRLTYM